jgi:multidrug resistance efflux pump
LKYVANGQPVEVALNLYPGQIFKARVAAIWKASGTGQLLPSGTLPTFQPAAPETP